MADTLSTSQKAKILVDGANPPSGAIFSFDPSGVAHADATPDVDGATFVHGDSAGTTTLTVNTPDGVGSDELTVTQAELAITLDTPVADV